MATVMYTNWKPYLNNISNSTNNQLLALIQQTSIATNYTPGILILAAFAIIIFVVLKSRQVPTASAFAATAFAHAILATLAYPLVLINGTYFYFALVLVPIAGFMLWLNG